MIRRLGLFLALFTAYSHAQNTVTLTDANGDVVAVTQTLPDGS